MVQPKKRKPFQKQQQEQQKMKVRAHVQKLRLNIHKKYIYASSISVLRSGGNEINRRKTHN